MSCDNLPHNGVVCKQRITGAAEELVCGGICSAALDEFVVWLQTEVGEGNPGCSGLRVQVVRKGFGDYCGHKELGIKS
jgi:hypothetical protein